MVLEIRLGIILKPFISIKLISDNVVYLKVQLFATHIVMPVFF